MNEIKSRIFLVGCPRSGTTLLQSLLAAHEDIISFPESHFFIYLLPKIPYVISPKFVRNILGNNFFLNVTLGHPRAKKRLQEFQDSLKLNNNRDTLGNLYTIKQYTKYFVKLLDEYTLDNHKLAWVEKTPDHLFYVDYIDKLVKNSRFIHLIRDGCDVVSSLYDVSSKFPEIWEGGYTIDQCINKWKKAILFSKKYINHENHIFTSYDRLTTQPSKTLRDICNFLGISFSEKMVTDYKEKVKNIVLTNEPWKKSVNEKIENKKRNKFEKIFTKEQREYIIKHVSKIKIDEFPFV
ncbi:MAG: sulfotransferase [Candidatus Heimdallarchaeum aukensis]|uniref:Sulfotransferase n=1 Tax=Candidatus Heimdallarchaeum aukensis TaxID=2876573 RepID=A0A9Y1BME8_9ARCH|nr:MAG: sulfotransferase [Candidatus Heimdallarchaeum aukensis]